MVAHSSSFRFLKLLYLLFLTVSLLHTLPFSRALSVLSHEDKGNFQRNSKFSSLSSSETLQTAGPPAKLISQSPSQGHSDPYQQDPSENLINKESHLEYLVGQGAMPMDMDRLSNADSERLPGELNSQDPSSNIELGSYKRNENFRTYNMKEFYSWIAKELGNARKYSSPKEEEIDNQPKGKSRSEKAMKTTVQTLKEKRTDVRSRLEAQRRAPRVFIHYGKQKIDQNIW